MKTKILLVSSFEPWSLGLSYLRAFNKMGYEPLCFDMAKEYEGSSRLTRNRYTNRIINSYALRKTNEKLLSEAIKYKPDLILVHKGSYIYPETLQYIKADTKALLFNFNPDDPFNPNPSASSKFIRDSISMYDVYFIWSKTLISKLNHAEAKRVEYLPFAYDPYLHHPILLTGEDIKTYGADVAFVGNWDEEREEWLSKLDGYNLAIWGADYWKTRCKNKFLKSCWKGRQVYGNEMSKVCLSSKINLNILRQQNKGSHNMRTYEIPACKAFALYERSKEQLDFFEEGKEVDYFSTAGELRNKIDYYLGNNSQRQRIAISGYERCTMNKYSYADRIQTIISVFNEIKNA